MPIRAVTLDLWLTLVWDTPELDEYWRLRRLINFHHFVKTRQTLVNSPDTVSLNAVRLAMKELSRKVNQARENGIEISPQERGQILFDTLGIKFARNEEQKIRERAGAILSNSGFASRLPYLNPEAKPLLRQLKNDFPGIRIGLISNESRSSRTHSRVLTSLGIMKYFDSLTISCDVGFLKPRREIFERAVRDLSVEPSEILHIGDSFDSDIVGAASFGMNAVLYTGLLRRLNDIPSWRDYALSYGTTAKHIPQEFKSKRGLLFAEISSLEEIPKLIQDSR